MKRLYVGVLVLIVGLTGCGFKQNNKNSTEEQRISLSEQAEREDENIILEEQEQNLEENISEEAEVMKIRVTNEHYEIIYQLNDSTAAKELYEQLPLTLEVKDFSTNEKTFYPPKELNVQDSPMANADKGTLAYYAPWADVVMFYDYFGEGSSLYELGEVVSGKDDIENLNGTITVEAVE